jgi:hypothetical protein
MLLIETPGKILFDLEPIDIENNEYLFWDSAGAGVCISIERQDVKEITLCDQAMSLRNAFETYARAYGLQMPSAESPIDIWKGLESQLPPRRTLWSRLFGKSKS